MSCYLSRKDILSTSKYVFCCSGRKKKPKNVVLLLNMKCGQRFIRFLSMQWSLLIKEPVRANWQSSADSIYMWEMVEFQTKGVNSFYWMQMPQIKTIGAYKKFMALDTQRVKKHSYWSLSGMQVTAANRLAAKVLHLLLDNWMKESKITCGSYSFLFWAKC